MGTKVSGLGVESDFGKHVSQGASHAHRTAKFFHIKGAFINVSAGAGDAGKPIKLDSSGKIDSSMYDAGANHSLLSATHPDTLAGVVVRGDLVVGNATPKWKRLGLGVTGKFLRSDGNDALWASIVWGDVSKIGSNLTDLVTRAHAGLSDAPADAHHPQSHSLASHSTKPHSALSDAPADAHHPQSHSLASHSTKPHSALSDAPTDAHHNEVHILVSAKHTVSGLTIGHVLTATSPTAIAFQAPAGGAAVPHPFLFVGY